MRVITQYEAQVFSKRNVLLVWFMARNVIYVKRMHEKYYASGILRIRYCEFSCAQPPP